jgi:hypothetical protein
MGKLISLLEDDDETGRGPYKPKNQLDGFLRHIIRGKYKWRRYEIFYEYLEEECDQSREEANAIVEEFKTHGVGSHYSRLADGINSWRRHKRKLKAFDAVMKRWERYSLIQQKKQEKTENL